MSTETHESWAVFHANKKRWIVRHTASMHVVERHADDTFSCTCPASRLGPCVHVAAVRESAIADHGGAALQCRLPLVPRDETRMLDEEAA